MSSKRVTISEFRIEDIPASCSWIIVGPPGSGKCLAKGTEVVTFEGILKKVEDIVPGDVLLGDDSTARNVLGVTTGRDVMYKITQSHGDTYIVNSPHILCLKRIIKPRIVDVCFGKALVEIHAKKPYTKIFDTVNEAREFIESGVFDSQDIIEISAEKYYDLVSQNTRNPIREYKGYKSICSFPKHVANIEQRFKFLADIIDTPYGIYQRDHYLIFVKRYDLAKRIKFIADSLGFYVTLEHHISLNVQQERLFGEEVYEVGSSSSGVQQNDDFKISIYGNISMIPTNKMGFDIENTTILSDISIERLEEGEYYGFEIDGNKRFLLGDCTVTHNTTFIENMMYFLRHRYPVARAFIGTEGAYKRFCKIMPKLFVSNYYDEEEEKTHILRQKTCDMDNGKGHPSNYAINILDDVSDDPRIYKSKIVRGLFKLGSQHWHQLLMVGSQYIIDMPPDVRKSVSYVAIFMEPEEQERKKIYSSIGGLAGSYENFCDLMDQITGDYTCLIFKKRTQTNNIEENVFFYKTVQLPEEWKFGCDEFWEWNDERYDPEYQENLMV